MSKFAIGLFLILYGIVGLIATKLPEWLVPAAALLAGAACWFESFKK
jgi:hypothetical protein